MLDNILTFVHIHVWVHQVDWSKRKYMIFCFGELNTLNEQNKLVTNTFEVHENERNDIIKALDIKSK